MQLWAAGREGPQSGQRLAQRTRTRPRTARADLGGADPAKSGSGRALSAFLTRELGLGSPIRICQRGWASATFAGARHELVFSVPVADDAESVVRRLDALDEDGFDLPGHILADISGAIYGTKEDRRLRIEALTVEAG